MPQVHGLRPVDAQKFKTFIQDCCISFKKKTAINAGPVKK